MGVSKYGIKVSTSDQYVSMSLHKGLYLVEDEWWATLGKAFISALMSLQLKDTE